MKKNSQGPLAPVIASLSENRYLQVTLIILLIIATYLHTLDVPFYLDDNGSLRNNPAIQGFHFDRLWAQYSARFVGYFTFALNFSLHGYEVGGYHLFNISLHVINSLLVFYLTALLIRTPVVSKNTNQKVTSWLPLLAALLFALHPLQTQAITYIVQRLASMAAFFYFASIILYLQFRFASSNLNKGVFAVLAFLTFILGFLTKQNAITVPLVWLIIELVCFSASRQKILLIGGAGILALLAGYFISPLLLGQSLFEFIDSQTRETILFSRIQYLSVQMHVLLNYLAKLFIPINLSLNYENPMPSSFFELTTLVKALIHLLLIGIAALIARKQPLVSFGILFYYTAHIVESSIIPIRDFGFDHRTYIPNAGLCITLSALAIQCSSRFKFKYGVATSSAIILALSAITWHRNNLWRDPIAFFTHETKVLAESFRAHCLLGQAYYEKDDPVAAVNTYKTAWPLRNLDIDRGNNNFESCASNYVATLQEGRLLEEALALFNDIPVDDFSNFAQSKLYNTRGNIDAMSGSFSEAQAYFEQSMTLNPNNVDPVSNLAKLKILTGELNESYSLFLRVAEIAPGNRDAIIGIEYLEGVLEE